jgi:hypothetical protein
LLTAQGLLLIQHPLALTQQGDEVGVELEKALLAA